MKQAEAAPQIQPRRDFVIPGCEVVIQSNGETLPIGDLLALAFSVSNSNPDAKIEFWLKIVE